MKPISKYNIWHKNVWTDDEQSGLKIAVSKGRVVVIHAGGENGFVQYALVMCKSRSNQGDYHSDMNSKMYEKWIREKLVPNLEDQSMLVIDNTPYHT